MIVEISKRSVEQIEKGSLWIFANEFVTKMSALKPGEWVNFESKGKFVGYGYVNPHSLIAGRICSRKPVQDRARLIHDVISQSLMRRAPKIKETGSYRAVFSESDSLPGIIVDVYDKTIVFQLNTMGMDQAKNDVLKAIEGIFNPENIVIRCDSSIRVLEGAPIFVEVAKGNEATLKIATVMEDDISFAANFIEGQKTGFFIDQRENRRHLRSHSRNKTVLDLCSYSGGWGLSALKGGAQHVTFVDQSQSALDLVAKGVKLNGFNDSQGTLVTADVFDFLKSTSSQFDIVICDPPAFVKSKKNLDQAVRGYKKLNQMAFEKVKSGGLIYTCSCSFHLSEGDFEGLLKEVSQDLGRLVQVVYRGGQPEDHPWILNRPESHYLKCFALQLQ